MFSSVRHKALRCLKGTVFVRTSPSPRCFRLLQHHLSSTCTIARGEHSFTVSYLINKFGFSPETALKISKQVRFETSERPDSVVSFLENYGFSHSHIKEFIRKTPCLLSCDPHQRFLPKFEFFLSKGASISDIVFMVNKNPRFLSRSLENFIIPAYGLLKRSFQLDRDITNSLKYCAELFSDSRVAQSINLLLENGVTGLNIPLILSRKTIALSYPNDVMKSMEEVKGLGFNPSKTTFGVAFVAKMTLGKSNWEAKVNVYRRWGWSEEACLEAFRKQPQCMLVSKDKINAVMGFWVNQLGWNSLALVKGSNLLGYSLQKRIIPRASVLQFLQSKGLINKKGSLLTPFHCSEELFLERYVKCFDDNDKQLLKLYKESMKI